MSRSRTNRPLPASAAPDHRRSPLPSSPERVPLFLACAAATALSLTLLPPVTRAAEPSGTAGQAPTSTWPPDLFTDATEAWGARFHHRHGGAGDRYMPETMVGGVVMFDYDGDGDADLFFADGAPMPGYEGPETGSQLLRNDLGPEGPRFTEVTDAAGLSGLGEVYASGGVSGDVDGDGDADLYVTAFGPDRLYENRGDGTFREVTEAAGLSDSRWSAGAAFSDVDRDGDLDLYVSSYVDFTFDHHVFCGDKARGLRGYCHPGVYESHADRLYENRGDGTFQEVTRAAGLEVAQTGAGLGVVFGDVDLDGWPDLYVANDLDPNFFFLNRGDGTFEDATLLSGTGYSPEGRAEAGMGVDLGDVDGDGLPDVVVTNFELETNGLYRNLGGGLFTDLRFATDIAEPSLFMLAFGACLEDLDGDGDLDLAIANGHILDNAAQFRERSLYHQPNQLFENITPRSAEAPVQPRFAEAPAGSLAAPGASRGMACGDLEGDLDPDLVVVESNQPARAHRNQADALFEVRRLAVSLEGLRNRVGIGSRLVLTRTDALPQAREIRAGSSYLSQNPPEALFSLSEAKASNLEVTWSEGARQRFEIPPDGADKHWTLFEPARLNPRQASASEPERNDQLP